MIETAKPIQEEVSQSNEHADIARTANLSGRLSSAVSLTGIGSIITMAASSLAGIAVARNAGPSGYGVYVSANMLVFVSAVLCSFGLPLALAKYDATQEELGNNESARRSHSTALMVLLVVTLLVGLAIAVSMSRLEAHLNVSIGRGFAFAFPLVILCAVVSDFAQGIYIGLLRLLPAIIITVSGPVMVILYSLSRSAGARLPIWGAVAALYLTSGLVAGCCLVRDQLLGRPAALPQLWPIFKDLIPAAAFTFFTIFSVWCDRWIVGTQLGEAAMGAYSAAVVVIQAALRVPKHMAYLLVPASTRVALKGAERSRELNRKTINLFGLFAVIITISIMLGSGTIVRMLFGPGFVLAGPVLLIMAPGLLAAVVSVPFVSVLTGSTKNRSVTYLLSVTVPPRVVLLLIFTRFWGLQGTALATLVADCLLAVGCILMARKLGITFPLNTLVEPLLIGVLAYTVGLAALFFRTPPLIAIALAVLVFAPTVWKSVRAAYEPNKPQPLTSK